MGFGCGILVPREPQSNGHELIYRILDPIRAPVDFESSSLGIEVFRGTQAASVEFGLVLEAKGLPYERLESAGVWVLRVAPSVADSATDELRRYASERVERREPPAPFILYAGSGVGAAVYAMALILVAVAAAALARPVESLAKLYGSQFHLQGLGFTTGVLVLALAASLSWLGSWLAATRHIRGIEPT